MTPLLGDFAGVIMIVPILLAVRDQFGPDRVPWNAWLANGLVLAPLLVMLGLYSGQSYFGVTSTASGSLKGAWISTSDGVLHVTGGIISGGTIDNATSFGSFVASCTGSSSATIANGTKTLVGYKTASATGGSGTMSYLWTASTDEGFVYLSGANTATVAVSAKGTNQQLIINLVCAVTDDNGRTDTTETQITVTAGSP